jgi:cell division septal protein FtsQ
MREQVIASRSSKGSQGSQRATAQPRGFVQRPARRNSTGGRAGKFSPRALLAYAPWALKFIFALLILAGLIIGYRVAASASLFQLRSIDVTGTSRTSAEEIEGLTRRAVARSGVWRADLAAISAELGRLPGVRRAMVSRVLPDRLRVRVTERVPVAVAHTSDGHFFWVDEEGVALGEMKPADRVPSFFIRGWNEEGTDEARRENAERVQKYLEIAREWEAMGLSERVSEIDLIDVRSVRAQLAGKDSQIEVRLGRTELGARLKLGLEVLDEYRQTPRGSSIIYLDLQTGRVVIGFSSGDKVSAAADVATADSNDYNNSAPTQTAPKPASTGNSNRKGSAAALTNNNRQKPGQSKTGRDEKPGKNARIRAR